MSLFKVIDVIDGDTFDVSPNWKWNYQTVNCIRPTGYNAPELYEYGGQSAKEKLHRLIYRKQVELRTAHKIDRGGLVCDVYFEGRHLADYFPEYKV